MTREEIDVLWSKALVDAVRDGEQYTRYHFAAMIEAAEREACAVLMEANASTCNEESMLRLILETNAAAIRARGQT